MAFRKHYTCVDHLVAAVASLRSGDADAAETHISAALKDGEIEAALEDIDEENTIEAGVAQAAPTIDAESACARDKITDVVESEEQAEAADDSAAADEEASTTDETKLETAAVDANPKLTEDAIRALAPVFKQHGFALDMGSDFKQWSDDFGEVLSSGLTTLGEDTPDETDLLMELRAGVERLIGRKFSVVKMTPMKFSANASVRGYDVVVKAASSKTTADMLDSALDRFRENEDVFTAGGRSWLLGDGDDEGAVTVDRRAKTATVWLRSWNETASAESVSEDQNVSENAPQEEAQLDPVDRVRRNLSSI